MRIGIELNGIVRDIFSSIEEIYKKTFLIEEDGETKKFTIVGDNIVPIVEDSFTYGIKSPVTSFNIAEHLSFRDNDELFSFLYEENPTRIFGMAELMTLNSAIELNSVYKKMRNEDDLVVVSNEIGLSKPATLLFLGRNGILLEEIVFYSEKTLERMWNNIDVLVTTNPDLSRNKPENKILLAFSSKNEEWGDFTISSISDITLKLNQIKNV